MLKFQLIKNVIINRLINDNSCKNAVEDNLEGEIRDDKDEKYMVELYRQNEENNVNKYNCFGDNNKVRALKYQRERVNDKLAIKYIVKILIIYTQIFFFC